MSFAVADHAFMARALQLASRGLDTTTPNPRVGCLLVKDSIVVGEGWHRRAGEPHAEALALSAAGKAARGCTAYVTLEPCVHHGRTPPCADALVGAGVARVVAAMRDPNPLVAGEGFASLQRAGIAVDVGLMEAEARELNIGFVSRMTRGRPWLRLKVAASLDGKTALNNGISQWITGAEARRDGHRWRARACAILTGIGTVREDDPQLGVRDVPCERQPLRILVDARLEVSAQARILQGEPILIATASTDETRIDALRAADPGNTAPVPVDLVTASASGLDPHLSPAAAAWQAARVARARALAPERVQALIARFTEDRSLGVLGEARVNVLQLNLALAREQP